MNDTEVKHYEMVKTLVKNPNEILGNLDETKVDYLHGVLGVVTEAGELADALKKVLIYNRPTDLENIIEELGDLEFYMAQIRQRFSISREQTLQANLYKLSKRYPKFSYTDQRATERADKIE